MNRAGVLVGVVIASAIVAVAVRTFPREDVAATALGQSLIPDSAVGDASRATSNPSAPDSRASESIRSETTSAPVQSAPAASEHVSARAASTLMSAGSFSEGLELLAGTLGKSDPAYASAYAQIAGACATAAGKAKHASLLPVPANSATDWAVAELMKKCGELDRMRAVSPEQPAVDLASETVRSDYDTVSAKAMTMLQSATDAQSLAVALETLINTQRLPSQEIFGGQPALAPIELLEAVWSAALLRECEFSRQCGPGSIPVLAYCVEKGCARNRSLYESMRDANAARSFDAIVRLQRWLALQNPGAR